MLRREPPRGLFKRGCGTVRRIEQLYYRCDECHIGGSFFYAHSNDRRVGIQHKNAHGGGELVRRRGGHKVHYIENRTGGDMIKKPLQFIKRVNGFTLIELMVSMAIGLVILSAIAGTFTVQTRQNSAEEQLGQMQQNVRGALDLMIREIQMAKYDPEATAFPTGTYGVTYSASQLQIRSDIDGNGTLDSASSGSVENIIYVYDSANLRITRQLGTGGTAQILADNVTAFTFNYYDANGSAVTSSASSGNIRKVTLSITAKTARPDPSYPSNGGYRTYQISADVTPPNMAL
jgi:type IV pilus assembly protein PilW